MILDLRPVWMDHNFSLIFTQFQSLKCRSKQLKKFCFQWNLSRGVIEASVSICQLTSQNFEMLPCGVKSLFAKTSEAGHCHSVFFVWKWRIVGGKKKTSLSHDWSEALDLQVKAADSVQQQNCSSCPKKQCCKVLWGQPRCISLNITDKIKEGTVPKLVSKQLADCICGSVLCSAGLSGEFLFQLLLPSAPCVPSPLCLC